MSNSVLPAQMKAAVMISVLAVLALLPAQNAGAQSPKDAISAFEYAIAGLDTSSFTIAHKEHSLGGPYSQSTLTYDGTEQVIYDKHNGRWKIRTDATTSWIENGKLATGPASNEYTVTPQATIYAQNEGSMLLVSGSFKPSTPGTAYLYNSAFAFGFLVIDYNLPLVQILRQSNCKTREATHDGKTVLLLECDGKHGSRKLWLDPTTGYLPLRIEVDKGPDDVMGDSTVRETKGGGRFPEGNMTRVTAVVDNVTTRTIGARSVLAGFRQTITYHFSGGRSFVWTSEHELRDVDLAPNLDAPGTFLVSMQIPDGTPVFIDEDPNIPFRWAGGRVVKGVDRRVIDAAQAATFSDDATWGTTAFVVATVIGLGVLCVAIAVSQMRKRKQRT